MARAPIPAAAEAAAVEEAPVIAADVAAAEETAEPVVVLTVLKNADGSFTLETGDEPEMGEGGEAPMAAEGQSFGADEAGVGKLMTAILDLVDPENPEGPAAAANFQAGFEGKEPATAAG